MERIGDPEISPCSYCHLTFDKCTKTIQEKKNPLKQTVMGKQDSCVIHCTKIIVKEIRHLKVKPEIWKLPQKNIGRTQA
jgi:hypothetical protein